MTQYVSTPQAAAALGVSVSTIKRWVDEGILPAHRTAGKHRKLLLSGILRLVRQLDLPRLDLAKLGIASDGPSRLDTQRLAEQLYLALRHGRTTETRRLILSAYRSGLGIAELADGVIAPAMNQLGHHWETGKIDVFHEHRATQLCAGALYELKSELEILVRRERPRALGGAPETDDYALPTLLAQMVLLERGWDSVNLGPNTPMTSLVRSLSEIRPRLVWLSVSHLEDEDAFVEAYASFYRAAEKAGVPVAVGGRLLNGPLRTRISYTSYGDRLEHLAAFAESLDPSPAPPRRGRPKR